MVKEARLIEGVLRKTDQNPERKPDKIPCLKDFLNKPVQKQEEVDVCHCKIPGGFRLFDSQQY